MADNGGGGQTAPAADAGAVAGEAPRGWRTVGHDGARKFLLRGLQSGRLAHAFLIAGPAGVGKMSLAKDLARAVNCESTEVAGRPCGECRQCQRVTRGLHADVRVVTPETPIESDRPRVGEEEKTRRIIRKGHIDDLQHKAALKPFEGRSQVFVIDGAELMQAAAANALLKTLEEPEDQVVLVLLTAVPAVLPETIVSRCQRIDLRPVPAGVIERHLIEALQVDPSMAQTLARAAGGSPGWAIAAVKDPTALEGRRQSIVRVLGVLTGNVEDRFRYTRTLAAAHRKEREAVAREMAVWLALLRDVLLVQHGQGSAISGADFRSEIESLARAIPASAVAAAIRSVRSTMDAVERNAMVPLVFDVLVLELPRVDPSVLPSLIRDDADQEGETPVDDSPA